MVADFLLRKQPEADQKTGDRLAYALIAENGYEELDHFPVLDGSWPTISPALPVFLAGPNERLQTACSALGRFLDFTDRWNKWLALSLEAETKAVAVHDFSNAGWRAINNGWLPRLRGQPTEVLACADRAAAHWREAKSRTRERAIAIGLRGSRHLLAEDEPAAIVTDRDAVELDQTLGRERVELAISLSGLADVEQLSSDFTAAERDFRESLWIAKVVRHPEGVAEMTGALANLALEREDWRGAEKLTREALLLSERLAAKS